MEVFSKAEVVRTNIVGYGTKSAREKVPVTIHMVTKTVYKGNYVIKGRWKHTPYEIPRYHKSIKVEIMIDGYQYKDGSITVSHKTDIDGTEFVCIKFTLNYLNSEFPPVSFRIETFERKNPQWIPKKDLIKTIGKKSLLSLLEHDMKKKVVKGQIFSQPPRNLSRIEIDTIFHILMESNFDFAIVP